nr:hemerythrin domain-containing protein [uncultured Duganella sp.]
MLTATYVLLTLSIEQKKERHFISRLMQHVQSIARRPQEIDPVFIESQLKELTSFAEARHQRKVEACLMPAVRAADSSCAALINDLESLSRLGGAMLNAVHKCLRRAMRRSASQGKFLCRTIDLYCQNLLKRLDKEEQELLPLAQKVISSDEWFEIGTRFLEQEDGDAATKPELRPRRGLGSMNYSSRVPGAGAARA